MAKYTAELNEVVQINNGEIETFFDELLATYPLFNPAYREELNKKIIKHYYFHEIGFETAERFVFEVNRKMDEIMLYYNKLYESEIKINPLINYRKVGTLAETGDEKELESINVAIKDKETSAEVETKTDTESETLGTTGTRNDNLTNDTVANRKKQQATTGSQDTINNNDLTNTGTVKDVKSDTPTSQILTADIDNNYYASEAAVNNSTNNTAQTTKQNIAESQVEDATEKDESNQTQVTTSELTSDTTKSNTKSSSLGKEHSNERTSANDQTKDNKKTSARNQYINDEGITISESELIMKYRETFLNIDMDIIKELRPLFMLIL